MPNVELGILLREKYRAGKEFCNYEQSLVLKKLGIDKWFDNTVYTRQCLGIYSPGVTEGEVMKLRLGKGVFLDDEESKNPANCLAPLIIQGVTFLAEKYNLPWKTYYQNTGDYHIDYIDLDNCLNKLIEKVGSLLL